MSLFLLTIGIVFNFVPGMFRPFDTGTAPDMVTADRSAARLAEDLLVEDLDRPGRLNATCTAEFFDDDGSVGDCRFDADGDDLATALGVDSFTGINVTIESGGALRTVDGVPAASGPTPPPSREQVSAKRVVLVDGDQGTLTVRVW